MTDEAQTLFTDALEDTLPAVLDRLESRRVLLLTTPSRRFVERVQAAVGDRAFEVFDQARVHVPAETVKEALAALRESKADTLITLGGGAATGLAKALRLEEPGASARFVAIPTTYSASEQTTIYGVREGGEKKTGRDPKARPDAVIYDTSLTHEMPAALTAKSLMNALAHPISALTENPDEAIRKLALRAIEDAVFALEQLAEAPTSRGAREAAFRATARCGAIIERGKLGRHHRMAHFLGGTFDLDHAGAHSILLLHNLHDLAREEPALYATIAEAAGVEDLPGRLFEILKRGDAPTTLGKLGVEREPLMDALAGRDDLPAETFVRAFHGGWPSVRVRVEDWDLDRMVRRSGPAFADADRVVIAIHGRGSNAFDFTKRVLEIVGDDPGVAIVAPQATDNRWYSKSYTASPAEHGDELKGALDMLEKVVAEVLEVVPPERVFIAGFSQGGCLTSEYVARSGRKLGGLIAMSGARIGPLADQPTPNVDFDGMPVLLGAAVGDKWVPPVDIEATAEAYRKAGAAVDLLMTPGNTHEIAAIHRIRAREILLGRSVREGHAGFGNAHASEALEGAIPARQNTPLRPRYALFAEQVNATGFTAKRHANVHGWLYRIRPSAQHTPLEPLEHPTFVPVDPQGAPEPNLSGWAPMPYADEPMDFVDSMATFGGAGDPRLRRGFAVHLYAANRSMEQRCFYDADGDLLLVPQEGRITLMTELGVLDVDPGRIATIPRGLKFSVLLRDERARGWVGEVFGRSFELPERGPVGANGLTDGRHFRAPSAYHEDRLEPGYRVTLKHAGHLFEGTQDHSPFDVAGWHGNYAPYVYDLMDFSPVGNLRFDHGDPSIFTVLSSPLDEQGAHGLDFVFFPPRWDVTEDTFRPPFFHRNAVTELNGVIRDPGHAPFESGTTFLTPPMTAHGVRTHAVERFFRMNQEAANRPRRSTDASMWWQFESVLPLTLTEWAKAASHRNRDWPHIWGAYRSHYPGNDTPAGGEPSSPGG